MRGAGKDRQRNREEIEALKTLLRFQRKTVYQGWRESRGGGRGAVEGRNTRIEGDGLIRAEERQSDDLRRFNLNVCAIPLRYDPQMAWAYRHRLCYALAAAVLADG